LLNDQVVGLTEKRKSRVVDDTNVIDLDEVSNVEKSRSGRVIVTPREFWRNEKLVKSPDGTVIGLAKGSPYSPDKFSKKIKEEPKKATKRIREKVEEKKYKEKK